MIQQKQIVLPTYKRGFHLITSQILKHLPMLPERGLLNLFIQHTSAGITLNENTDPTVLHDLNSWFDENIKENEPYYKHTCEGPDDMPAHIKTTLTNISVTIPIINNALALGVWQGIYLCEFRNNGGQRKIIASIQQ